MTIRGVGVAMLLPLVGIAAVGAAEKPASPSRGNWAYTTPQQPSIPSVSNRAWIANPVDAFILAKLEEQKLQPSPRADKLTLLRRVTFDLTGLPPTVDEQEAFLSDRSDDAYRKVVDRLLKSPPYGE